MLVRLSAVICSQRLAWTPGWENSSNVWRSLCCEQVRLLNLIFYCIGTQVRVNVSAGLGDPLLLVSSPLEVAPLLVVTPLEVSPPLEVAPLMRSRVLSVVQVWVILGMVCKQGGYGGGGWRRIGGYPGRVGLNRLCPLML